MASTFSRTDDYDDAMNGLIINVNWEYFLGIVGSLILIGYYANGRFTRLETNFHWLSETVRELTIKAENLATKLFNSGSPISLTVEGRWCLEQSGLRSYIDEHQDELVSELSLEAPLDLYRVQETAFRLFARAPLNESFTSQLNKFAFRNGLSTDLLRRIGAIYLRDLVVGQN